MSDTGRVHQFFSYLLYTNAKENGEGIGESSFAAVVEKIMQQKCIRGIVVNNRITSVLRKKIGAICAKLKRAKKKSGGSVSRSSLTNGATKLILSSYFTSSWMINVMKTSAKRIFEEWHYQAKETWGRARRHREKLQVWQKKIPKIPTWWIFTRLATLSTAVTTTGWKFTVVGFLHVLSLNKSPVEKTRRSIVFGTLLSLAAAMFTNVNCHWAIYTLMRKHSKESVVHTSLDAN